MTSDTSPTVPRRAGFARSDRARGGPVELCYEEFGSESDPAVLLVMGWSTQMLGWPAAFCERIAEAGHRVVRFDNRDIGQSTKFWGKRPRPLLPSVLRAFVGANGSAPNYDLTDLAQDATAVLDHLGIDRAHVVGASMGGMIGQILAADHADRVLSFGAIFTSPLRNFVLPATLRGLPVLLAPPPANETREQSVERLVATYRTLTGKIPMDEAVLREELGAMLDRGKGDAGGAARQLDGVLGTGSLVGRARRIARPTVVIHGDSDPLIRPACGKDLAKTIPGARLKIVPGMGHTLPEQVWDLVIGELTSNFARAASS
ncbi:MAG: alpha/beta fold hydrolase [Segniliparus sp.]|uniref:alpha/beta fold hydrolase n=1 Tax=Segniliparus sp. TaxID=2804064 RepID=UPI003F351C32